jgi:chromosomal replication initiation ATPase DnaA
MEFEAQYPSIALIQKELARHFEIKVEVLVLDPSRSIARVRQVAMYFARIYDYSWPSIGKAFAFTDHTTVMHAFRRVEGLILAGHPIWLDVTLIDQSLITQPKPVMPAQRLFSPDPLCAICGLP